MSLCSPKASDTSGQSSGSAMVVGENGQSQSARSVPAVNINLNSYPLADTTTYEEIVQNPELFMEKLSALHRSVGNRFKLPIIGGKPLNLHQLFIETTSRGGIEKVIDDRKWKEVVSSFNFPASITSGSFALRKYYLSILYWFEQIYFHKKQIPPITLIEHYGSTTVDAAGTVRTIQDGSIVDAIPITMSLTHGSQVFGMIYSKFENGYLITINSGSEKGQGVLYHLPDSSYGQQVSSISHLLSMPPPSMPPPSVSSSSHILSMPPPLVSSGIHLLSMPPPLVSSGSHLLSMAPPLVSSGSHLLSMPPPSTSGLRRKRKRNPTDPGLPKPKRSGYNFFFSEQYNILKPSHRGQERAMTRKIGLMWNQLTDAEKQVYQEMGKEDKERYNSEMVFYNSNNLNNNKEQEQEQEQDLELKQQQEQEQEHEEEEAVGPS